MTSDSVVALRQTVEAVRAQIPKGELTLASVERLLQAAETVCAEAVRAKAVCAETHAAPVLRGKAPPRESKRQEARRKWAQIARQNASEGFPTPITAE